MCGRFTLTNPDRRSLGDRFRTEVHDASLLERVNVAPTEEVLAVTADRQARALRWGITPHWSDRPFINARTETVATKRPFADLVRGPEGRCLVIADGFYEWMRAESGKGRPIPFRFRLASGEPFAFAGLWCEDTCTILTCAPNPFVSRLHDRMPVILGGPAEEEAWLTADLAADDLPSLCCPLPEERMVSEPADPAAINSTRRQKPDPQESLF